MSLASRIENFLIANTSTDPSIPDSQKTVEFTAGLLAFDFNVPEPSIRRAIQVLRREGFNISFALNGGYVYRAA